MTRTKAGTLAHSLLTEGKVIRDSRAQPGVRDEGRTLLKTRAQRRLPRAVWRIGFNPPQACNERGCAMHAPRQHISQLLPSAASPLSWSKVPAARHNATRHAMGTDRREPVWPRRGHCPARCAQELAGPAGGRRAHSALDLDHPAATLPTAGSRDGRHAGLDFLHTSPLFLLSSICRALCPCYAPKRPPGLHRQPFCHTPRSQPDLPGQSYMRY